MVPIFHMGEGSCRVIYVPKAIASRGEWGLELRSDAKDMTAVIAVHHLSNANADRGTPGCWCLSSLLKGRYDAREH